MAIITLVTNTQSVTVTTTQTGTAKSVHDGMTLGEFLSTEGLGFEGVTVNGYEAEMDIELVEGDVVSVSAPAVSEEACCGDAACCSDCGVAQGSDDKCVEHYSVLFFDHDFSTGFAERINIQVGSTVEDLIEIHGSEIDDRTITVNGLKAELDTVLNDGDKITIVPTNISGAASRVIILDSRADAAKIVAVEDNTTVLQFFEANSDQGMPDTDSYMIRVNGAAINADYVLRANDKISVVPVKLEGAVSA